MENFEKMKVWRNQSGKRHEKGQQGASDESMTIEESWMTMKDRADKEHEGRSHSTIPIVTVFSSLSSFILQMCPNSFNFLCFIKSTTV